MKRIVRATLLLTALSVAAAAATVREATPASAASPMRPLETAFVDPFVFTSADAKAGLERAAAAGATTIKIPMFWDTIAPATRPAGFNPSDPKDPAYYWTQLDTQLRHVRAVGLEPLVYIAARPDWALRKVEGYVRPDPKQYAAFALAATRRYSGSGGLPRVRYWQAWNEPNKVANRDMKPSSPAWYRTLVNAFARSVHSQPGNFVVAGALAPFGISTAVAPLAFMRSLLCVSSGRTPRSTCSAKIRFDVWSTHPYSAGGPTHHALRKNDVSIGDLPEMKAILDAGVRTGHILSKAPVRFWVTEFSWDSNPPDPKGVPTALEARWVAEALYRMWSAGVSLVTWYTLRDQPPKSSPYQSGLYFRGPSFARDRPKPALTAYRFPFVAFGRSKKVFVWGRTPSGRRGSLVVEQRVGSRWRRLGALEADRVGIFSGELTPSGRGPLRALVGRERSVPFSLVKPPERTFQPFGT